MFDRKTCFDSDLIHTKNNISNTAKKHTEILLVVVVY